MAEINVETQIQQKRIRDFNIGSVLIKTFNIYFRRFIPINLTAIAVWLPLIVSAIILDYLKQNSGYFSGNARWILVIWSAQQVVGAALLLVPILYPISAAIIFHTVFRTLRDGQVRFLTSISQGLARGFYVILLSLLGGVILIVATLVTLFPIVWMQKHISTRPNISWALAAILPTYLALLWCVALPACVVEGLGPIAAMGRSRRLTLGQRWRVLGAGVIFAALFGLLYIPLEAFANSVKTVWFGLILILIIALLSAFAFVVLAAIYHELRRVKEGGDIQSVAAVFD